MKKMAIYEPAMCCPTGICGVGVDPELLRISTVLNTLKKNGVIVDRYNLTNSPQEFVNNTEINKLMMSEGVEILPVIVVDGKIMITKRYPTNDEFIDLLNVSGSYSVGEPKPEKNVEISSEKSRGCGCKGGCC